MRTLILDRCVLRNDSFFHRRTGLSAGSTEAAGRGTGQLPNHIATEGHTDSKPHPPSARSTNWELFADRANAARHLMQMNGTRKDQITPVRGFADQRLRKPHAPLDPVNRRISLIVQFIQKPEETSVPAAEGERTEASPNSGPVKYSAKQDEAKKPRTIPTCRIAHWFAWMYC